MSKQAGEGGSRLDRLLRLLREGSSQRIKSEAASQIADICVSKRENVVTFLVRLAPFLADKDWDTRQATAEALGKIASAFPLRSLADADSPEDRGADHGAGPASTSDQAASAIEGGHTSKSPQRMRIETRSRDLSVKELDIRAVVASGCELTKGLMLEQKQWEEEMRLLPPEERKRKLRKRLLRELNLDNVGETLDMQDVLGISEDYFLKQEDAETAGPTPTTSAPVTIDEALPQLSARERAQLKRRGSALNTPTPGKRIRTGDASGAAVEGPESASWGTITLDVSPEAEEAHGGATGWPLLPLAAELSHALLDPAWEVRHGACAGLREIFSGAARGQGRGGATASYRGQDARQGGGEAGGDQRGALAAIGEGCLVRLIVVLALDRLTDVQASRVVAPVAETAAQALAVMAGGQWSAIAADVAAALLSMLRLPDSIWQVRHGGLLGLKYLAAAAPALFCPRSLEESGALGSEIPVRGAGEAGGGSGREGTPGDGQAGGVGSAGVGAAALEALVGVLECGSDVCQAVAAQCLSPLKALLLERGSEQMLQRAVSALLTGLGRLDDLDLFASSAVDALGSLLSSAALPGLHPPAAVPLMLPFLFHGASAVRSSAISSIRSLLLRGEEGQEETGRADGLWTAEGIGRALQALVQAGVTERSARNTEAMAAIASEVAGSIPSDVPGVSAEICGRVRRWMDIGTLVAGERMERGSADVLVEGAGALGDAGVGAVVGGEEWQSTHGSAGVVARVVGALGGSALDGVVREVLSVVEDFAVRSKCSCVVLAGMTMVELGRSAATGRWRDEDVAAFLATRQKLIECLTSGVKPAGGFLECRPHRGNLAFQWSSLEKALSDCGMAITAPADLNAASPDPALVMGLLSGPKPEGLPGGVVRVWNVVLETATGAAGLEDSACTVAAGMIAAGSVSFGELPKKLNCLIQPLIGAIRKVKEPVVARHVAEALASILEGCEGRAKSPNDKILSNLCLLVCSDESAPKDLEGSAEAAGEWESGGDEAPEEEPTSMTSSSVPAAADALRAVARRCGDALPSRMAALWSRIAGPISDSSSEPNQETLDAMHLLYLLARDLAPQVLSEVCAVLHGVLRCVKHPSKVFRDVSVDAICALVQQSPALFLPPVISYASTATSDMGNDSARKGASSLLHRLLLTTPDPVVPYSPLLLAPLISRMSDPDPAVRRTAAAAFGRLVTLLPLAAGRGLPESLPADLKDKMDRDYRILDQLLDSKHAEDYELPIKIAGELRAYQKEGVNWLAFLRHFGLHGVLADDMGLGKTLQTSAVIAASAVESARASAAGGPPPLPSLVVCPATLVEHWAEEVHRWIVDGTLRVLPIQGHSGARRAMWEDFLVSMGSPTAPNLVVVSYETLRSDIGDAGIIRWDYVVLDEGHYIRNPTSAVHKACKELIAQRRLVLSGTPIQNDVLELWSLFDFLMPGFLGTRRQFNAKFGKVLKESRRAGKAAQGAEEGVLALERLHRQVMPFILRRTKDQVLKDLPPKVIQDVLVEPSAIQKALLPLLRHTGSEAVATAKDEQAGEGKASVHVFQSLQLMRKLCTDPGAVLDPSNPSHLEAVQVATGAQDPASALSLCRAIDASPKMVALKDILLQCGIGMDDGDADGVEGGGRAGDTGHRVLVFAQARASLDLVETLVLAPMGVPCVRLDGSMEPTARFAAVRKFREDPTIPVMLLTTHVGGLGLNLTAADTVVFLEHDWNPMKDLQAMDRAHRLGQTRTVNVYRLLTRGTLEEQIMSLQKFKMDVAAAVVNQENVSLESMDASRILGIFEDAPAVRETGDAGANVGEGDVVGELGEVRDGRTKDSGMQAVIKDLDKALNDAERYEDEFSLERFSALVTGDARDA